MTTYRRYQANYPFDARDSSELSIAPGQMLLVSKNAKGEWPSQEKWMHGRNEETDMEGDFPGNFVEFVEEFTESPPETKALPPLPQLPSKPPPGSRGGIQVLPFSVSSPAATTSSPPRSATSPTHHSTSPQHSSDNDDAPPPPPRMSGRRGASGSQLPGINQPQQQQQGVVENHRLSQDEIVATPPPVASRGPPVPRPRARKPSETPQHSWMAVSYQIPVECNACELATYQITGFIEKMEGWRQNREGGGGRERERRKGRKRSRERERERERERWRWRKS